MHGKNLRLKISRTTQLHHRQSGFTLLEILIGITITGILAAVVGQSVSQMFIISASNSAHMTAIKQVENVIEIIRKDALMAQAVTPDPDANHFLRFIWTEWTENKQNQVYYSLVDNQLQRRVILTDKERNVINDATTRLAGNIESIAINNKIGYNGGNLTITVTARVKGFKSAWEVRTFEVLPRPGT